MRKIFTLLFLPFIFFLSLTVQAQVKNITGKVTSSEDGMPLPGVGIKVKGTSTSVISDQNGNFSITVPGTNSVLVATFIGFVTQEITVGSRSTINVTLVSDINNLQEVVINTGLGITRQKKSLGYSAQGVEGEDLNFNHQSNLLNALQGKVAGATITSVGGGPGQGSSIRIRGVNSIDANTSGDPLYVIDGVQIDNTTSTFGATQNGGQGFRARSVGNRASDVNPEDIETINILKGGAATALYGLRGANGVVVITTKRGKGSGFQVNFSNTYGLDEINKMPEVQTTYTSGVVGNYNNGSNGIGPAWGPTIAEAKLIDPSHPDKLFNNYERAYETGNQAKSSISVAGGSETIRFFSSASTLFQKGIMPGTDYKNLSARLNTDITISPKIKAGVNMNFTNSGGFRYSPDRFGESLTYWAPRVDVADYVKPDGTQKYVGTNNPVWGAKNNRLKDNVNRFIGGANLSYQALPWLNFSYRFGVDTYSDNRVANSPAARGVPGEVTYDNSTGLIGEYNTNFRTLNSTFIATFSSKITADINGTLRLGHELYNRRYKETRTEGTQFNIWNFYNLANAKALSVGQSLSQKRLQGIFGEATFDYKDFLFLTLTGRNDITSTLSKSNRSFFYPSASLSYVFSDQLKLPEWIGQSKLRFSYAKLGKDANEYSTSYGFGTYTLPAGFTGLSISSNLGNADLRPEFTNTYDAGLEMSFLKNRLGFDFTFYYSISKDQIVQSQISSTTGYITTSVNAGDIRNRGIELVLRGEPIKATNFSWDVLLNFSMNRNKVLTMPGDATEYVYGADISRSYGSGITQKIVKGQSYGNIYGNYFMHYGPNPEDPNAPLLIGANGYPVSSGTAFKLLGNSQPDWIGGITNNFRYKRFNLSTLIDARWGFEKYDGMENFHSAFGLPKYTENRRTFKVFEGVLANGTPNTKSVWMGQGMAPDGVVYSAQGYYRDVYRLLAEPFVQDASWIKLRSISLGYAIPTAWLPKKVFRSANLSVTANNILLHTNFYGLDPESSAFNSGSNIDGSAGFTYPAARSILFTLNVGL
ncbi:SusC/RagA family TonB-linked outer membrane protein [Pedobacter insulae]|uniref:TonB-linked outer membrane protein, SusC/RagA family n=1 Tax=Pedobacter insulae TaxID=414048 RepID=A0A1I2ZA91_9SPHI|nr:SusC/RagA family TonB-linked outer membrane protein [Pedobacter insulae]SFH34704.1 TonB-linked outer membrane protein, SusC/RagA family [Pedobacter insulae]